MPSVSKTSGIRHFAFIPAIVTIAAALSGCGCSGGGGSGPTNIVKGKVTLGGQPVTGDLIFIDSSKKEYKTTTALNGDYSLPNLPKGDYVIIVKGMGVTVKQPAGTKELTPDGPKGGVEPPAKYAKPDNGLKLTVTGGDQVFPIELTQ
jgi:hypothetical protein